MKSSFALRSSLVLAALGAALLSQAAPLTYAIGAIGSGTLNGTSFTDSLITLTATADTSSVLGPAPFLRVPVTTRVSVAGIGSDTLSVGTMVFGTQVTNAVGFGTDNAVNILYVQNASLKSYDLKSSLAPTSGPSGYNAGLSFATTRGTFSILSVGNSTFSASLVPEPATLTALGLGAVVVLKRRKRA